MAAVRDDLGGGDSGGRPGTGRPAGRTGKATQDVFAFDSEDGLKTIVARAAAGDAVWFLATVNRIAEILAARGDTDPLGARRAKAVGILARPAEALRLLIDNQHDDTEQTRRASAAQGDGRAAARRDPSRTRPSRTGGPGPSGAGSRSRMIIDRWPTMPPGLDVRAARPKVVLHFHLSDAAVRSGHGIVRPEHGGPTTLENSSSSWAVADAGGRPAGAGSDRGGAGRRL